MRDPPSVASRRNCLLRAPSFTLIELLVVIAIIAVLAGLLLSALGGSKERAKVTTCLSNFRQISLGIKMYIDDNDGTYPLEADQPWQTGNFTPAVQNYELSLGGHDADAAFWPIAKATNRPLYPYIQPSAVFRCPADKGQEEGQLLPLDFSGDWKPSNYEALGCSYRFNTIFWGNTTRQDPDDPDVNLGRKKEGWVTEPSRMIVLHEPPAFWYGNYYHWHFARGMTTVRPSELGDDPQKFISPILFADGHATTHDFTHALKDDPDYPMEPTRDWYWYEPKKAAVEK